MATPEDVKDFSKEINAVLSAAPPVSRAKMASITKAALKSQNHYKHIVMLVEKFISKCPQEYKIPGLYIVDSIVRQSKHNNKDKDVYGQRFAKNLPTTFTHIFKCKPEEVSRVIKVLNLWQMNKTFGTEDIQPLHQLAPQGPLQTAVAAGTLQATLSAAAQQQPMQLSSPVAVAPVLEPVSAAPPEASNSPQLDPSIQSLLEKVSSNKTLLASIKLTREKQQQQQQQQQASTGGAGREEITGGASSAGQLSSGGPEFGSGINQQSSLTDGQQWRPPQQPRRTRWEKMEEETEGGQDGYQNWSSGGDSSGGGGGGPPSWEPHHHHHQPQPPPPPPSSSSSVNHHHHHHPPPPSDPAHMDPGFRPAADSKPPPMDYPPNYGNNHHQSFKHHPDSVEGGGYPSGRPPPLIADPTPFLVRPRFPMAPGPAGGGPPFERGPPPPPPGFDRNDSRMPPGDFPRRPPPPPHPEMYRDAPPNGPPERFGEWVGPPADGDRWDRWSPRGQRSRSPRRGQRWSRSPPGRRSPRRQSPRRQSHGSPRRRPSRHHSRSPRRRSSRSPRRRSISPRRPRHGTSPTADDDESGASVRKSEHLTVFSKTIWVGHLKGTLLAGELKELLGRFGEVLDVEVITQRGCAYIKMATREGAKRVHRGLRNCPLPFKEGGSRSRSGEVAWAPGRGTKGKAFKEFWLLKTGVSVIPWSMVKSQQDLDSIAEGGEVDIETLPPGYRQPRALDFEPTDQPGGPPPLAEVAAAAVTPLSSPPPHSLLPPGPNPPPPSEPLSG